MTQVTAVFTSPAPKSRAMTLRAKIREYLSEITLDFKAAGQLWEYARQDFNREFPGQTVGTVDQFKILVDKHRAAHSPGGRTVKSKYRNRRVQIVAGSC